VELHLDIVGQMTGDMFIAALLDAFPDYEDAAIEAIDAVCGTYPVDCRLEQVRQDGMGGCRFLIEPYTRYFGHLWVEPEDPRVSWSVLHRAVLSVPLPGGVARHALGLLMPLARHQAARHDISLDAVTFPKNDAWQMLAQLVGAAVIIDGLGRVQWTASSSGHGWGTSVGNAILAYVGALPDQTLRRSENTNRSILFSGVGFAGLKRLGVDHYLRANCFDSLGYGSDPQTAVQADGDRQGARSQSSPDRGR
jgi:hypothetical protein